MRIVLIGLLLALSTRAGDLYRHIQTPWIDAYIDSSVDQQPPLPGLGRQNHVVSVSFTSSDDLASSYIVVVKLRLADGDIMAFTKPVNRTADGVVCARFSTGAHVPVSVFHFYIVRLHAESADQLIYPY